MLDVDTYTEPHINHVYEWIHAVFDHDINICHQARWIIITPDDTEIVSPITACTGNQLLNYYVCLSVCCVVRQFGVSSLTHFL